MQKQPWSPEEKERLRRLREETGAGPKVLAAHFPNRTLNSVRGQYEQLELGSASTTEPVELIPEHRRIFTQMLRTHAAKMTPAELMRHWNEHIAPQVGAPHLRRGTVDYWITKLKLRQPDAPAKAARSPRRRKVISRRLRMRGQKRAVRRRKEFQARRELLFRTETDLPRHECARCKETWPATAEFFKLQKSEGREPRLDLASCKLCRNERRRVRSQNEADGVGSRDLTVERRAAARAAIAIAENKARSEALAEAAKLLETSPLTVARECVRCEGRFPLDADHFARHTGGNKQLKHLCVYCDRAIARQKRNATADRDTRLLGILVKERRKLARKGREQEARERRARLVEQARAIRDVPKLQCPKCFELWPKTEEYWTVQRTLTQSETTERLRVSMCRCCWNERHTAQRRQKKKPAPPEEGPA